MIQLISSESTVTILSVSSDMLQTIRYTIYSTMSLFNIASFGTTSTTPQTNQSTFVQCLVALARLAYVLNNFLISELTN